jgi:circadian clock protein KaiC
MKELRRTLQVFYNSSGWRVRGKTTFDFSLLRRSFDGQIALFCSLEESPNDIRTAGQSIGYDVKTLEKKGLHILSWIPENQSQDAFISELVSNIDTIKPSRIVVDGLSGFKYSSNEEIYLIAKRLCNLFRSKEITSIITILQPQQPGINVTSLGLSSIFQNIIVLRYFELESQIKRSLLILKMRASNHDQSIIEFLIVSDRGIKIVGPMKKYTGIMSGIAQKTYQRSADREQKIKFEENMERRKRKQKLPIDLKEIDKKEKNMKNKRRKAIYK